MSAHDRMTPTSPRLSAYGERMASAHGIPAILQRAARARTELGDDQVMDLNAGNPPLIDQVVAVWNDAARAVLADDIVRTTLSRYGHISGHPELCHGFADLLARHGFAAAGDILAQVLVTPGALAFIAQAVHAFVGPDGGSGAPRLLLPQSPDFEGYRSLGLPADAIVTVPPRIKLVGEDEFRYGMDWDALERIDFTTIGAVVLSRPCNPTGAVCPGHELARLATMAAAHGVPVIVDAAYAPPIPSLVYGDQAFDFVWADNVIHVFSMSKAGLPGERIGVAVAAAKWLQPLRMVQAHLLIMSSKMGQAMAAHAIGSGALARVCETVLRPHYRSRADRLRASLAEHLTDIRYRVHQLDGGVFAWIWFPDLRGSDRELLEHAAREGLFFTPGSLFFDPQDPATSGHGERCIRVSLTTDGRIYERAVPALARSVRAMHRG